MKIKITLSEVKKRVKNLAKKDKEIQEYLEETQKGKSGMYPYHVASDIAVRWQISLEEAYLFVNEYIAKESEVGKYGKCKNK